MRIAVSGANGLIGSQLVGYLRDGGHQVFPLVTQRDEVEETENAVYWDHHLEEIEAEKLEGLDGLVHLSPENVFSIRWSESDKMQIFDRRVRGTHFLAETLAGLDTPPRVFLSESSTGYYGDRGEEVLTEESPPGDSGFLMALCLEWEDATTPAADAGIQTVPIRLGVVFTTAGGALEYLLTPFRWGLGGRIGRRGQYFSWIALDDVLGGIHHLLETDSLNGPVNLSAPHPVTAEEMANTLSRVLSRPAILKIPEPVTRFLFGKSVEDLLLNSTRAEPKRLLESGYDFHYPHFEPALRHLLKKQE